MTSLGRYVLIDKPIAVGTTGAWMKGPVISYDDMNAGSGGVERISVASVFGADKPAPSVPLRAGAQPTVAGKAPKQVAVMWFGKHRGRPMSEVQEMEPGYWRWCMSDVSGFRARAVSAGLEGEDLGMDEDDDEGDGDACTANR